VEDYRWFEIVCMKSADCCVFRQQFTVMLIGRPESGHTALNVQQSAAICDERKELYSSAVQMSESTTSVIVFS